MEIETNDQKSDEESPGNKEETEDQKCIKTNAPESRQKFCETALGGRNANSSKCENSFCDFCCASFSKNLMECQLKCKDSTRLKKISEVELKKCEVNLASDALNIVGCKSCCDTYNKAV